MDALSSMIQLLETPIAKRKGVFISSDDCKIWAEELSKIKDIIIAVNVIAKLGSRVKK